MGISFYGTKDFLYYFLLSIIIFIIFYYFSLLPDHLLHTCPGGSAVTERSLHLHQGSVGGWGPGLRVGGSSGGMLGFPGCCCFHLKTLSESP